MSWRPPSKLQYYYVYLVHLWDAKKMYDIQFLDLALGLQIWNQTEMNWWLHDVSLASIASMATFINLLSTVNLHNIQ